MYQDQCAIFIDAGFLLCVGTTRVTGTSLRDAAEVDVEALIKGITACAKEHMGLDPFRIYWYDASPHAVFQEEHKAIALLDDVKVRLGRIGHGGQQKGVDLRLGLDLVEVARNRVAKVAYLLTGDDDLAEAVEAAQDLGMKVVLIGLKDENRQSGVASVANHLSFQVDRIITLPDELITDSFKKSQKSEVEIRRLPEHRTFPMLRPNLGTTDDPSAISADPTRAELASYEQLGVKGEVPPAGPVVEDRLDVTEDILASLPPAPYSETENLVLGSAGTTVPRQQPALDFGASGLDEQQAEVASENSAVAEEAQVPSAASHESHTDALDSVFNDRLNDLAAQRAQQTDDKAESSQEHSSAVEVAEMTADEAASATEETEAVVSESATSMGEPVLSSVDGAEPSNTVNPAVKPEGSSDQVSVSASKDVVQENEEADAADNDAVTAENLGSVEESHPVPNPALLAQRQSNATRVAATTTTFTSVTRASYSQPVREFSSVSAAEAEELARMLTVAEEVAINVARAWYENTPQAELLEVLGDKPFLSPGIDATLLRDCAGRIGYEETERQAVRRHLRRCFWEEIERLN